MPSPDAKLIAFVAGGAIALLAVLVVGPLLDSEPRPAVPAIEVGVEGPAPGKARRAPERRRSVGADPAVDVTQSAQSGTPSFAPAPRPQPRPEPAAKPPAAPTPAPAAGDDDDVDDDDGESDDDVSGDD